MDGWMDGSIDRLIDWSMDRWTNHKYLWDLSSWGELGLENNNNYCWPASGLENTRQVLGGLKYVAIPCSLAVDLRMKPGGQADGGTSGRTAHMSEVNWCSQSVTVSHLRQAEPRWHTQMTLWPRCPCWPLGPCKTKITREDTPPGAWWALRWLRWAGWMNAKFL